MSSMKFKADNFLRVIAVNERGDVVSTSAVKKDDGEVTFIVAPGHEMRVAEIEEAEYLAITEPAKPPVEAEASQPDESVS